MKLSAFALVAAASVATTLAAPGADRENAMARGLGKRSSSEHRVLNIQERLVELNKARTQLASHITSSLKLPVNLNSSELKTNPRANAQGPALPDGVEPSAGCEQCNSSLSFPGNEAARRFEVGNQIPALPFKTKTSWAGNIDIQGDGVSNNPSLFFWMWGKDSTEESDDLVIWLNGGPGCSSLGGMLQELGPFLYESVEEKPFANPYSWTKGANLLFVEQPVKTGFTTGSTSNSNEDQVAQQFFSFLDGFYEAFPELKSKNLYITGESYAGTYIPNIMNYIYTNGNPYNLKSGIIIDGVITEQTVQQDLVVLDYARTFQEDLRFTDSDIAQIKNRTDACGLSDYLEKNLKYPAQGKLPDFERNCDAWNTFYSLALDRNSQFNVYNIRTDDDFANSPLGEPNGGGRQYLEPTFFDDYELQSYINAPHKKWVQCAQRVFPGGDQSPPPDQKPSYENNILADIIEASASPFIIMSGDLDALLITNGSSVALQNLTWNGAQGFTQPPSSTPLIDSNGKQGGTYVSERNLQYAVVPTAGHMIPYDTQAVGFAALETLIGQRSFSG